MSPIVMLVISRSVFTVIPVYKTAHLLVVVHGTFLFRFSRGGLKTLSTSVILYTSFNRAENKLTPSLQRQIDPTTQLQEV